MAQSTSSEQLSASNHHEPCSVPRPDYAHNSASVVSDGQITDSSPDPQPTNSLSPVTGQPTSKSETRSTAETIRTVPPELLATANEGATLLHTPATSDSAVPTSLPSTASVEDRGEGEGGVDPLMLKYMELVKQRREGETKHLPSSHSPQSEHSQVSSETLVIMVSVYVLYRALDSDHSHMSLTGKHIHVHVDTNIVYVCIIVVSHMQFCVF